MVTKPQGLNQLTMRTPFTSQRLTACRVQWRDLVGSRYLSIPTAHVQHQN